MQNLANYSPHAPSHRRVPQIGRQRRSRVEDPRTAAASPRRATVDAMVHQSISDQVISPRSAAATKKDNSRTPRLNPKILHVEQRLPSVGNRATSLSDSSCGGSTAARVQPHPTHKSYLFPVPSAPYTQPSAASPRVAAPHGSVSSPPAAYSPTAPHRNMTAQRTLYEAQLTQNQQHIVSPNVPPRDRSVNALPHIIITPRTHKPPQSHRRSSSRPNDNVSVMRRTVDLDSSCHSSTGSVSRSYDLGSSFHEDDSRCGWSVRTDRLTWRASDTQSRPSSSFFSRFSGGSALRSRGRSSQLSPTGSQMSRDARSAADSSLRYAAETATMHSMSSKRDDARSRAGRSEFQRAPSRTDSRADAYSMGRSVGTVPTGDMVSLRTCTQVESLGRRQRASRATGHEAAWHRRPCLGSTRHQSAPHSEALDRLTQTPFDYDGVLSAYRFPPSRPTSAISSDGRSLMTSARAEACLDRSDYSVVASASYGALSRSVEASSLRGSALRLYRQNVSMERAPSAAEALSRFDSMSHMSAAGSAYSVFGLSGDIPSHATAAGMDSPPRPSLPKRHTATEAQPPRRPPTAVAKTKNDKSAALQATAKNKKTERRHAAASPSQRVASHGCPQPQPDLDVPLSTLPRRPPKLTTAQLEKLYQFRLRDIRWVDSPVQSQVASVSPRRYTQKLISRPRAARGPPRVNADRRRSK